MLHSIFSRLLLLLLFFVPLNAFAGAPPPSKDSSFDWEKDSNIKELATQFVLSVGKDDFQGAYNSAGDVLREYRTLDQFTEDMKEARFDLVESVQWNEENAAIPALPANGGYKLRGKVKMEGYEKPVPVYIHVQGDAHVDAEKRDRNWSKNTKWTIMDYRSADSMGSRFSESRLTTLDWFLLAASAGLLLVSSGFVTTT